MRSSKVTEREREEPKGMRGQRQKVKRKARVTECNHGYHLPASSIRSQTHRHLLHQRQLQPQARVAQAGLSSWAQRMCYESVSYLPIQDPSRMLSTTHRRALERGSLRQS